MLKKTSDLHNLKSKNSILQYELKSNFLLNNRHLRPYNSKYAEPLALKFYHVKLDLPSFPSSESVFKSEF